MIFFDYILNRLRLGGGGSGGGSVGGDGVSIDILSFREQFTGDGIATTFQLTGAIENATYDTGVWSAGNIKNTYPSDVVNQTGQPIYDGVVLLVRNRISVLSISIGGLVTLSNPPRNGVDFDIWYFYRIDAVDTFTDYRREDFVASMEADLGDLDAKIALKYDASNPNSYETSSQLNTRDTNDRTRANHTGTQLASTISDFKVTSLNSVKPYVRKWTHIMKHS